MSNTLISPTTNTTLDESFRFEQSWFFPQLKQTIFLFTQFSGFQIIPILFKLDIKTLEYTQLFPVLQEDYNSLLNALSNISVEKITKANITFNSVLNKYLITYSGMDKNPNGSQPFVVNIKIINQNIPRLESVDIYKDGTIPTLPPLILNVHNSLVFTKDSLNNPILTNTSFSTVLPILNGTTSCEIIEKPTNGIVNTKEFVNITNNGFFTRTATPLPKPGTYQFNFSASNSAGTTYYCVTLVVS
jgi:hypothetical protein